MKVPKPKSRPDRVSLWQYMRLFRSDILSAQPERLYRAWMAEFRTPFFRSFLVNQPELIQILLKQRPQDFPKSNRIAEGLRPLLGESVFLTNGETWARQRRIIDPAFAGGQMRQLYPMFYEASEEAAARFLAASGSEIEIEQQTSRAAADIIFRTLFSLPIDHDTAAQVFRAFQDYQRAQPILNLAAFIPLPRWFPRIYGRQTRANARIIRDLITQLVEGRAQEIRQGTAPDDLSTKLMTQKDPRTGTGFSPSQMVDQVAIFFLAGHETSASVLAWALYLLATHPEWQEKVAQEARAQDLSQLAALSLLKTSKDVFREALRLYPPVPMMVRQAMQAECFRNRDIPKGAQLVISPWHLHRHTRIWEDPDRFDPGRWQTAQGQACARQAFIPFSAGPRACPGAGFAMVEGPLLLAQILRKVRLLPSEEVPEPIAHLTLRSAKGIRLRIVGR
jgi:cytochrome P450